jgi:hypothetical protein
MGSLVLEYDYYGMEPLRHMGLSTGYVRLATRLRGLCYEDQSLPHRDRD